MAAVLRTSFFAPFFFVLLLLRPQARSEALPRSEGNEGVAVRNGGNGSERCLNLADIKRRRFPRGHAAPRFSLFARFFGLGCGVGELGGGTQKFPSSPAWPEANSASPRTKEGTSLQARAANQRRLCRNATFLRPAVTKRRRRRPLRLDPDTPRATSRGHLIHLGPNPDQPEVD